jgi:hypothetical protein
MTRSVISDDQISDQFSERVRTRGQYAAMAAGAVRWTHCLSNLVDRSI